MSKNFSRIVMTVNIGLLMACGGDKKKSEPAVESSVPLAAGSTVLRSTSPKDPVIASIEVTPDAAKKSAEVSTTVTSPNSSPDKIKLVVTYSEKSGSGSPKNAASVKYDAATKKHLHSVASLEEGKTYVVSVEATDEKSNKVTASKEFTFGTKPAPTPAPITSKTPLKAPPGGPSGPTTQPRPVVAAAPTVDLQLAQNGADKIVATIKATSTTSSADKISLSAMTYETPAPAVIEWTKAKTIPVGQPYTVENLVEGKTYAVYVKATDEAKKETVASKELTIQKPKALLTAAELELFPVQQFLTDLCIGNPNLATKLKDVLSLCTFRFLPTAPRLYAKYQVSGIDREVEISAGKINLNSLELINVPDSIGKITNLTSLNLSLNNLQKIPDSVGDLTNLTELSLQYNKLNPFPESIAKLANLTKLNLEHNEIPEFPDVFDDLAKLVELDLSINDLPDGKLPPSIGTLVNLTKLDIGYSKLSSVPNWVGNLTKLTDLEMDGNQFTGDTSAIGKLKQLTQLSMANCKLETLPKSVEELTQLTSLTLGMNDLKAFPAGIQKLTKLRLLRIYQNHIPAIPLWVNDMTTLQTLSISENELKTVPLKKSSLPNLTYLNVVKNQLSIAEKNRLKTMFGTDVTTD